MKGCDVPKILPYKKVMSFIRSIDIDELLSLESLAAKRSVEACPGVYRPRNHSCSGSKTYTYSLTAKAPAFIGLMEKKE